MSFIQSCVVRPALLPRPGSPSRALGGSRSPKQIGRCHGQIQIPLKPLFISVLQKVFKKTKQVGAVCQEYPTSSSCAHHFLPFGAGDIENICLQMRQEEDRPLPPLLSRGPLGFSVSSFLIPLLSGVPVNSDPHPAGQIRQHRERFLQHPEWPGTSPPSPAWDIWAGGSSCQIRFTREDVDRNLIFIQISVLHELSTLLFLMAMRCAVTLPLGVGN